MLLCAPTHSPSGQKPPGDERMQRSVQYALMLCAAFPALVGAQGFAIYEQGACAMGRAGTGVAAPCDDGSAMYFNPAGLAGIKGGRATIGVTLLDVKGGFTDDIYQQKTDLDDPLLAVPQAYVAFGLTPKLGVGIGLFAPYGLETQWPLSFDGRFAGYDNILRSVYLQPTVAYQVTPWLSLGAGVDIAFGSVELNQRLDLAAAPVPLPGVPPGTIFGQFGIAPGTDFANAHLEATHTSVAAHFGTLVKVNDRVSFGARFLTQANRASGHPRHRHRYDSRRHSDRRTARGTRSRPVQSDDRCVPFATGDDDGQEPVAACPGRGLQGRERVDAAGRLPADLVGFVRRARNQVPSGSVRGPRPDAVRELPEHQRLPFRRGVAKGCEMDVPRRLPVSPGCGTG
ncbi:MAG: hypothetical protein DMD34_07765 [Gemmatimonadetes bacterium]|nr:MAG: hypothetical protein DMD34_07765 [Gemmatimonadota bacterium]